MAEEALYRNNLSRPQKRSTFPGAGSVGPKYWGGYIGGSVGQTEKSQGREGGETGESAAFRG